jgi:hypothetical protein
MTGRKLYEANHLYMMKLALIETNQQRKYHIKISPIHSKDDLSIKSAEKVPNFAARWRAICKYFINPENKQPEGRYKIQQQYKEKRHTPILKEKKFSPTKSIPSLFSFQLIEASISTMRSLAAKRTENA